MSFWVGLIDFDFNFFCHSSKDIRKIVLLVFIPYEADQLEKTTYRICAKLLMQQLKGIDKVITVKRLFPTLYSYHFCHSSLEQWTWLK